jgi:hypothetical protein
VLGASAVLGVAVSSSFAVLFYALVLIGESWWGRLLQMLLFVLSTALAGAIIAALTVREKLWQVLYSAVFFPLFGVVVLILVYVAPLAALVTLALLGDVQELRLLPMLGSVVLGLPIPSLIFLFGAAAHYGLVRLSLMLAPPRQWIFRTRDHRSIQATDPASAPVLVMVYRFLAYLLLVGSLFGCWLIFPLFMGFVLFRTLRQLAARKTVKTVRQTLAEEDRPPIVYLRSFNDDGRHPNEGWLRRLNNGVRALLSPTLEERLARILGEYGPFVAIGKPGEVMPDVGAARMYVGDDDWQTVVIDLLSRPGASVVFQAGSTAGLRWELQTIGRLVRPEQVLIFLPFAIDASARQAEEQYSNFRSWARACLPRANLPATCARGGAFLFFDREWQPHVLEPRVAIPPRHPLEDVLRTLKRSKEFRPQPFFRLGRDWWKVLLLGMLLLVLLFVINGNVGMVLEAHEKGRPLLGRKPGAGQREADLPREAPLILHEGKAMPYRIRLAPIWKEVPVPGGARGDRKFSLQDGTSLGVVVDQRALDLDTFANLVTQALKKQGVTATLLEQEKHVHKGEAWLHLKWKLETQKGRSYLHARVWSGPDRAVRLVCETPRDDSQTRELIQEAFDGFELPQKP